MLSNGILLRSDIHKLFDAGYVTITPEYRVGASGQMREDFDDGENYLRLHEGVLHLPAREDLRPDRAALRGHNATVLRRRCGASLGPGRGMILLAYLVQLRPEGFEAVWQEALWNAMFIVNTIFVTTLTIGLLVLRKGLID